MNKKLRDWAYQNAILLTFLSVMFFLTWVVEVIANVIL